MFFHFRFESGNLVRKDPTPQIWRDDRSRLQNKALEQFKRAKAAQADYQLSTRIVSPAIVSIYQSAKP